VPFPGIENDVVEYPYQIYGEIHSWHVERNYEAACRCGSAAYFEKEEEERESRIR